MAKIKITFSGRDYQIDKSALAPYTANMSQHLQTQMSGTGAVINLSGNTYNVDSTKVATQRQVFVSHLGTISGTGSKVAVNDVEYSVDSTKISDARNVLSTTFSTLSSGSESGGDEPTGTRAAGLYETGTDNMVKSWDELIASGTIHVDNGVVYTNFDYDEWANASSEALTGDLVLPSDGIITSIGDAQYDEDYNLTGRHGFTACYNLTSITIPNSVTTISDGAFYESGITSIEIPSSVTSIGASAFDWCNNLTSVVLGEGVTTIGESVFSGCSSLTSVVIPNSVTAISDFAFNQCSNLTSVTIGSGVTTIGWRAFCECSSLTSIEIPNGVTSIGDTAFFLCSNLTSIVISDSVTSIDSSAFERCDNLANVYYKGTESDWSKISIGNSNDALTNATIHYNYQG